MNLICGINPVLEALQAQVRHFDRLLIVKGIRNRRISEAINRASRMGVALRFEAREALDRLAAGLNHQGIIAVVSAMPTLELEQILDEARDPPLLVVLDGVEDPRNLGAILRTVETAGADGVLLPQRRSAALSDTVARASAGALDHVRVGRVRNVAQCLETLSQRGVWTIGFDAEAGERWDSIDYSKPVALVFGGEGRGMRRLVRERCDQLASLPLFGQVGSLNVSVTVGIALYEVVRQRKLVPSQVRPIPPQPAGHAGQILGPGPEDTEDDPGSTLRPDSEGDVEEDPAAEPAHHAVLIEGEEMAWVGPTTVEVIGPRHRRGRKRSRGRARPEPDGDAAQPAESPESGSDATPKRRPRRRSGSARGKAKAKPKAARKAQPKASAAGIASGDGAAKKAKTAKRRRRRRRPRRS